MRQMTMDGMAMPSMTAWEAGDLLALFVMWTIMMAAMMLPSATPMVLLFANINRQHRAQRNAYVRPWVFVAGYLAAWLVFSLFATLAQWGLHSAALISPMMHVTPTAGGVLLIGAGLYQWSPLKRSCLAHCRSPLSFLLTQWRPGTGGAFRMGITHGSYCLGCCWLLMALLFVLGAMNLLWIAALSIFVLLEKVLPGGERIAQASGLLLVGWGAMLLLASVRVMGQ